MSKGLFTLLKKYICKQKGLNMSTQKLPRFLLVLAFLLCVDLTLLSAQNADRWFWPLGDDPGKVIMKPGKILNPVHGNVFFNYNYFIAGKKGQAVYAPVDGYVRDVSLYILSYPDGETMWGFNSLEDFYELKKKSSDSLLLETNLTSSVGIVAASNQQAVYISGLTNIKVKEGQRVKRGDYLGDMGYNPTFSNEPCIEIESPDVGLYLLGEDNSALFANLPKAVVFDPKARLSLAQMQPAVKLLTTSVLEDHPALLDTKLKINFENAARTLEASLYEGMPASDFLYQLRVAVAMLNCSHTAILAQGTGQYMLEWPLDLLVHEGKAYVLWDRRGKNEIAVGQEILAINGRPVKELYSNLAGIMGTDSSSGEVHLEKAATLFNRIMPMLGLPALYEYQLLHSDGSQSTVSLPRLDPKVLDDSKLYAEWMAREPLKSYEIFNENSAIIRLNYIDEVADQTPVVEWFRDLSEKKIGNLIVDLRGNPGGDTNNVAYFFSYFATKPFQDEAYSEIRHSGRYESLRYSNNMVYSETEPFVGDLSEYQAPTAGHYKKIGGETFKPVSEFGYRGQVYVLTDSGTTSAAVWLARVLAEQGAVTIGTETGGGFYSTNALKFNRVRLADTGLELYLPLIRSVFSNNMNSLNIPQNRGLIPRYEVKASLKDKLYGSDSILDFTLDLIKNPPFETVLASKIKAYSWLIYTGIALLLILAFSVVIVILKK